MLYMSGGGVQIFSMGIVFMLLLTPFKNIAGINDCSCPFSFLVSEFDVNLCSLCPFCAFKISSQILNNPLATETRILGMQYVDIRCGVVEVSIYGTSTNRHR